VAVLLASDRMRRRRIEYPAVLWLFFSLLDLVIVVDFISAARREENWFQRCFRQSFMVREAANAAAILLFGP